MSDNHGYQRRLTNERNRLESADITPQDRKAIHNYLREVDSQMDLSPATVVNRVKEVRMAATRSDKPLSAIQTLDEVNELLFCLKHDYELSQGTLRNYRKALRLFFQWCGFDWAEDIRIGGSPNRPVTEDQILNADQIGALLDACENARDKALIAFLLDTGFRIGAAISLRVGDVNLTETPATVTWNEDGPVKGASGTVLITWSHSYLSNWLDIHPKRSDASAALFHRTDTRKHESDGWLGYQSARYAIVRTGKKAGLGTLKPHTLRKTAISQWINDRLTDREIKHRAGWHKDSSQFQQYDGLTDSDMNGQIAQHYGLKATEDGAEPVVSECPFCTRVVRSTDRFCPGCARPLTQSAAAFAERIESEDMETVAGLPPDVAADALRIHNMVAKHPELKAMAADHTESSDESSASRNA